MASPVTIGNKTYNLSGWAQGSKTFSFDNDGSLLIVGFATRNSTLITTCTYNGVALTRHSFTTYGGFNAEIWRLISPADGVNNVYWAGNDGKVCCFIASVNGAHLSDPIGDSDQISGNSSSYNRTLTTRISSITLAFSFARELGVNSFSWNGSTVELYDVNCTSELDAGFAYRDQGEASTYVQVNYTGPSTALGLAVAEIQAATGGNQVIWIMSKMRDFFKDLREGLIPPEELQRRYRGLNDQGLVTI